MTMTRRTRSGFTLVELLAVITIIGILLGLVTAVVYSARNKVSAVVIANEISQLDIALRLYSDKYGEFPPDFCGVAANNQYAQYAQNMVLRHLRRAFPRYIPGSLSGNAGSSPWDGFRNDLLQATNNTMDANYLDPASALVFWLAGPSYFSPDGSSTTPKVFGFSANPLNPFESPYNNASNPLLPNMGGRLPMLFQFDESRLQLYCDPSTNNSTGWALCYYPPGVQKRSIPPMIYPPYIYFRAEGNYYSMPGMTNQQTNSYLPIPKLWPYPGTNALNISNGLAEPTGLPNNPQSYIYVRPYFNFDPNKQQRLTAGSYFNPTTFQIISSGLDGAYGGVTNGNGTLVDAGIQSDPPCLPSNHNLFGLHDDNVTNFTSKGTIKDTFLNQ